MHGPILDELVSWNLRENVHHPYLFTGCQYWESHFDGHPVYGESPEVSWEEMDDEEILALYSDPFPILDFDIHEYSFHMDRSHWPCSVIGQEDEEGTTYTVRIHAASDSSPPWDRNDLPRLITNYPREGIYYFVRPFESDQHLPGVFRHPIGIRNEIFPPQWKNLNLSKNDEAGVGAATKFDK